ncbi:MAG: Thiol:disulfide interchange protein [Candidatus Ozemobacter sibiricus]|uniref:Thiol:disulfide interchange protein n=1 Tax=Candidatus Ozemobacter sibiricus TaxID=2268124 RepID=A0A367ZJ55_9BACT|nr:MAG: Thiol:disulfide interchange protein [Candidatus Ozemobacter sibiricus]
MRAVLSTLVSVVLLLTPFLPVFGAPEVLSKKDLDEQEMQEPKPVIEFRDGAFRELVQKVQQEVDADVKAGKLDPRDQKAFKAELVKRLAPARQKCLEFRATLKKPEHRLVLDFLQLGMYAEIGAVEWLEELTGNWGGEIGDDMVLAGAEGLIQNGGDLTPELTTRLEGIAKNGNEEAQATAKRLLDPFFRNPVGLPFPAFPAGKKTQDGQALSLDRFKGKVLLVDFWATWCPPCKAEVPNLVAAYQAYKDKGFEIVGISFDEDKDDLDKYLAENKMAWPQYFDGKGWGNEVGQTYGIRSIPAMYLLDGDGKVLAAGQELRGGGLEKILAAHFGKK